MSGILVGPAYRDPDDEFEYWLDQRMLKAMKKSDKVKFTFGEGGSLENMTEEGHYTSLENAPDKLLKYAELIQIFENEIRWCIKNPDPAFTAEYRKGFVNGLIQAKYLVNQLVHFKEPGYMGDIGGVGCDPSDRDADYLGECTCGMGAGTIASEEHAEGCPMSSQDWYQFPGRFIE